MVSSFCSFFTDVILYVVAFLFSSAPMPTLPVNLPISHTSTRYMDFVKIFNIILDLSITCFSRFSGC